MRLIAIAAVLGFATPVFAAETYTISYDSMYDRRKNSLNTVSCSTGQHGLLTLGYNMFGDLPSYPFIGGAPQIQSWNSPYCGTCWELTYTDPLGIPTSLAFTAINTAPEGFVISFEGLNRLTGGKALTLDGASITASQVSGSECGLIPTQREVSRCLSFDSVAYRR